MEQPRTAVVRQDEEATVAQSMTVNTRTVVGGKRGVGLVLPTRRPARWNDLARTVRLAALREAEQDLERVRVRVLAYG